MENINNAKTTRTSDIREKIGQIYDRVLPEQVKSFTTETKSENAEVIWPSAALIDCWGNQVCCCGVMTPTGNLNLIYCEGKKVHNLWWIYMNNKHHLIILMHVNKQNDEYLVLTFFPLSITIRIKYIFQFFLYI